MGGGAVLGEQKAIMTATGVSVGHTLTVVVGNDDAQREVAVPDDLARALRKNAVACGSFDGPSFSHRREYVRHITEAKKPETRAKRVERTIEMLVEKAGSKKR